MNMQSIGREVLASNLDEMTSFGIKVEKSFWDSIEIVGKVVLGMCFNANLQVTASRDAIA